MGDERRRTKRIDVEANLSIRPITDQDTKEEFIAVHATNVSSGGIAFKTKNVPPLHSFYDMLLEMSGCDKIETVIEVVRIASQDEDGTEYGCRFVGLGKEAQFRIDVFRMVKENTN